MGEAVDSGGVGGTRLPRTEDDHMAQMQFQAYGTLDRGDGEADGGWDPPQCPDRQDGITDCGGDAYCARPAPTPEAELWRCSDCRGKWNGYGDWAEGYAPC